MFEASDTPRLFALPPGADFAREVVAGLDARLADHPPEARARVRLIANSERMARRLGHLLQQGMAGFQPRVDLVTNLRDPARMPGLPAPRPKLHRHLELAQLVTRLVEAQPDLAPRSAVFDLTESLNDLLDEMQTEAVPLDTVLNLDVPDQSDHWARALSFLRLLEPYLEADSATPGTALVQRRAIRLLGQLWAISPPRDPVVVVGSTGSRGTTRALMHLVAGLPQGAVILPGFDFAMPPRVWLGLIGSGDRPGHGAPLDDDAGTRPGACVRAVAGIAARAGHASVAQRRTRLARPARGDVRDSPAGSRKPPGRSTGDCACDA